MEQRSEQVRIFIGGVEVPLEGASVTITFAYGAGQLSKLTKSILRPVVGRPMVYECSRCLWAYDRARRSVQAPWPDWCPDCRAEFEDIEYGGRVQEGAAEKGADPHDEDVQMAVKLYGAGIDPETISDILQRPVTAIRKELHEEGLL